VPASIWLCLLLFAVGIVLLGFTRYGRALYAIGGNVDAAKAAGIRTDRVRWTALVGASLLAALGGLLMAGHLASVAAAQGDGAIIIVAPGPVPAHRRQGPGLGAVQEQTFTSRRFTGRRAVVDDAPGRDGRPVCARGILAAAGGDPAWP
jgi:simple sugar transport system permease protein